MKQRTFVLCEWWILAVLSGAFFIVACVTTDNVRKVHIINDDLGSLDTGLMGSIVLAALLSVLYLSTSASVLIGGWCSDFAEVYTWLGVVTTSSIWLGVVYIQAGLASSGFSDKAAFWEGTQYWTRGDTGALRAVTVLGFLLGVSYICFAAVLMCCQRALAASMLSPAFTERTTHILSEGTTHRV